MFTKAQFNSGKDTIEVFAIETGKVSMKSRAFSARYRNFPLRVIDIFSDKKFTEWLPIYAW